MTWTKPAESRSPTASMVTSVLSWKIASPSNCFDVSDQNRSCSGRSLLARAASGESNLTMMNNCPSPVTPPVVPSQPFAPGASSFDQRLNVPSTAPGSDTLALMIWTNMCASCLEPSELDNSTAVRHDVPPPGGGRFRGLRDTLLRRCDGSV